MCELLGMSFNQPVRPTISLRGFRRRGRQNPDGWGLALYPDKSVQIIKEPLEAGRSRLSEFLLKYEKIESKIFIAHVRCKSIGSIKYMNTHPFTRELKGKEYTFAHNGTLRKKYTNSLPLGRFCPVGCTDSEHAFCHILRSIEERDINRWSQEDFVWFWEKLKEISDYGKFNCLFADGEYLFCYYDKNGYNDLCFVHRKAPYGQVRLLDEDFEINLAEEKNPTQTGFIIATRRLTDERWENFYPGELIVFKNGRIAFSTSGRNAESFLSSLGDIKVSILKVLRQSPHRVRARVIYKDLNLPKEKIKPVINSLLCNGFIRQDSRDKVKWDHDEATFYTDPSKREEIDRMIRQ